MRTKWNIMDKMFRECLPHTEGEINAGHPQDGNIFETLCAHYVVLEDDRKWLFHLSLLF